MPESKRGTGSGARARPRTELSRDLSCFDVTMIGVGAMIGAGIFVLTGIAAGTAGPALILAFALNGVVTIFTAMVYAELGSAIPEAGGGYLWIKEGLPGGNAFMAGWMSWFAHAVAGSLYALGFGAYFGLVLDAFELSVPGLEGPALEKSLAVAVAILFVYINYRGASETGLAGNIVTVAKVAILGVFIASGIAAIWRSPEFLDKFSPFAPNGLAGVFSAMGLTFIAFEGYEIIVQAGEEVKDPRRNIPRAIFWSLAIVIPIYLLVAFACLGAVTPESGEPTWQWLGSHAEIGVAEAARQFMPFGTTLLLIGGLMSTVSALNATTFSSTRVSFAMGRDRNLPDRFATIHPRTRTPVVALVASAVIIVGMAIAVPIADVAAAADIMFLLLFLQVNVAALTLRKKYGTRLRYGYLTPFFPAVPWIGILTQLFLALFMFHFSPLAWYVTAGWLATGWAIWLLYARPRERQKGVTPVLASERLPRSKERYRVLLPIANPDTVEGLADFAARLARVQGGEVIVLHTLLLPRQLPASAARELAQRTRPLLDQAAAHLERWEVPASTLVRVSHTQPWRAIVDTIEDCDVDFVVMGWRGRSRDARTVIGRNIDRVVERAPCHMAVIEAPSPQPVERVLVPVANPSRAELLLTVARMLSGRGGRTIDLLHVRPQAPAPGKAGKDGTVERLEELAAHANEADPLGPRVRVIVTEGPSPVAAILERASGYDRVVLGSTTQSWFRQRVFGSVLGRIAARLSTPIVLVSPGPGDIKHGVQSFFDFFRDLERKGELEAEALETGSEREPSPRDTRESAPGGADAT